jgi:PAS domain S-box-containing protein
MWIYDQQKLAFLEVNHTAENRYGYTREEFLRMTILNIAPIEDISKVLRFALRPDENAPHAHTVSRHRNKAGDIFDIVVSNQEIIFQGRPAKLALIRH